MFCVKKVAEDVQEKHWAWAYVHTPSILQRLFIQIISSSARTRPGGGLILRFIPAKAISVYMYIHVYMIHMYIYIYQWS